jgi:hypothetical protein
MCSLLDRVRLPAYELIFRLIEPLYCSKLISKAHIQSSYYYKGHELIPCDYNLATNPVFFTHDCSRYL